MEEAFNFFQWVNTVIENYLVSLDCTESVAVGFVSFFMTSLLLYNLAIRQTSLSVYFLMQLAVFIAYSTTITNLPACGPPPPPPPPPLQALPWIITSPNQGIINFTIFASPPPTELACVGPPITLRQSLQNPFPVPTLSTLDYVEPNSYATTFEDVRWGIAEALVAFAAICFGYSSQRVP